MSWKRVLKFFGPRQFLEHFQESLGGDIQGGVGKKGVDMALHHPQGFLKIKYINNKYYISSPNEVIANSFSLKELLPVVEASLRRKGIMKSMEKAYDPDKMDAKRAKIQRRNESLRRQKKRDEEKRRQSKWEFEHGPSSHREEEHAMREFVAGRKDSPNFKESNVSPTKRRKKPKKGRLPPKPQRGRKK